MTSVTLFDELCRIATTLESLSTSRRDPALTIALTAIVQDLDRVIGHDRRRDSMPTKDQVRQAMDDLETAGAHVSPTTIRQQLGDRGSFRDIVQHYKQIVSEGPRPLRRHTNGTHASSTTLPPPPAPEPAPPPLGELARLEHYLDLARRREVELEAAMEELRVRAGQAMRMDDVREFNRKIVGTERALEAIRRDKAQYLSERARLR